MPRLSATYLPMLQTWTQWLRTYSLWAVVMPPYLKSYSTLPTCSEDADGDTARCWRIISGLPSSEITSQVYRISISGERMAKSWRWAKWFSLLIPNFLVPSGLWAQWLRRWLDLTEKFALFVSELMRNPTLAQLLGWFHFLTLRKSLRHCRQTFLVFTIIPSDNWGRLCTKACHRNQSCWSHGLIYSVTRRKTVWWMFISASSFYALYNAFMPWCKYICICRFVECMLLMSRDRSAAIIGEFWAS